MTFHTNITINHDTDELTREVFHFSYFDGKIVLNEYELHKRATKRHSFRAIDPLKNTYKRHNYRDYKKTRGSVVIPAEIQAKAVDFIKDQIKLEE